MFFKPFIAAAALVASGSAAAGTDVVRPFFPKGERPKIEFTEEQKSAMEQVKTLHEAGDHEGAHALMEASGFPGRGHKLGFAQKLDLTDAQKAVLEQARALHAAGDHDGAKKLVEDAGFPKPPAFGQGMRMKFRGDRDVK